MERVCNHTDFVILLFEFINCSWSVNGKSPKLFFFSSTQIRAFHRICEIYKFWPLTGLVTDYLCILSQIRHHGRHQKEDEVPQGRD